MTLDQLNQKLSEACAIPEEQRTHEQNRFTYELEELIEDRMRECK